MACINTFPQLSVVAGVLGVEFWGFGDPHSGLRGDDMFRFKPFPVTVLEAPYVPTGCLPLGPRSYRLGVIQNPFEVRCGVGVTAVLPSEGGMVG